MKRNKAALKDICTKIATGKKGKQYQGNNMWREGFGKKKRKKKKNLNK